MKKLMYLAFIFGVGFISCSKTSAPDSSGNFKYTGDSYFRFTNRGIEYDASSKGNEVDPNNVASLLYGNSEDGNTLSIRAFDANAPKGQTFKTTLNIIVYLQKGQMKEGIYNFISNEETGNCIHNGFAGCSIFCHGVIVPYKDYKEGYNDLEYTLRNSLNSTTGKLEITEFRLGEFKLGTAEGTMSGNFTFSGYSNAGSTENPGSASGRFENVKVIALKR